MSSSAAAQPPAASAPDTGGFDVAGNTVHLAQSTNGNDAAMPIDLSMAPAGTRPTPPSYKTTYKAIQAGATSHLAMLDANIQRLTAASKLNPLSAFDQAQLAQNISSRANYNSAFTKFSYDTASKYGAAELGLSDAQVALLGKAARGESGATYANIDAGSFASDSKQSDQLAKTKTADLQRTFDAATQAASDKATQDASDKASSDASAAALKTTSDSNQTMWDQASAHAADLVNSGLNTFDTALQGKSSQVSSLAATQVHSAGFADATSQGANAQTNLQAKGAAARGTLGSDLGSQAGTYLAGVAGQETDNAQKAQGVNAQGKIDLQNRNSQNISTRIDQLRQSGQIAASGNEQQIDNLLKTYQNDNTSAENKQKIGGQIIGLVLGGAGAVASAAIMAG